MMLSSLVLLLLRVLVIFEISWDLTVSVSPLWRAELVAKGNHSDFDSDLKDSWSSALSGFTPEHQV